MEKQTYWHGNGKLQDTFTKEWNELVPASGKAETLQGEVLRAAACLYYRWFNDGDRIQKYGLITDSNAEDAWGFLHNATNIYSDDKLLALIHNLADGVARADRDDHYKQCLELLMNLAITFAATRPLVPTESDFIDREWRDYCIDECGLREPEYDEDEWEAEEDAWEDEEED